MLQAENIAQGQRKHWLAWKTEKFAVAGLEEGLEKEREQWATVRDMDKIMESLLFCHRRSLCFNIRLWGTHNRHFFALFSDFQDLSEIEDTL